MNHVSSCSLQFLCKAVKLLNPSKIWRERVEVEMAVNQISHELSRRCGLASGTSLAGLNKGPRLATAFPGSRVMDDKQKPS
jgi:hypothetical protein